MHARQSCAAGSLSLLLSAIVLMLVRTAPLTAVLHGGQSGWCRSLVYAGLLVAALQQPAIYYAERHHPDWPSS